MKSFLKRLIIIGICALSSNVHATGIPTVDVAAIAQNLMSYTAEVANYAEVLSQWKKQYDQMTQQLNTMQAAGMKMAAQMFGNKAKEPAP